MGIAEEHEEGVTRPTLSSLRLVEDDHGESMTMIPARAYDDALVAASSRG
jgi:hypothetical protein